MASSPLTPKRSYRRAYFGFFAILAGLIVYFAVRRLPASQPEPSRPSRIEAIACLGRISPEGEIIHVAAPYSLQGPSIVAELRVQKGDWITNQQVIAITQNQPVLDAAHRLAESQVRVAERRLAQVKAGQKSGEIGAHQADVQRLEAERSNAQSDFQRSEQLFRSGAISAAELDKSRLLLETHTKMVLFAKEKFGSISEVREIDVALAQAELESAMASVRRAKVEYEQSFVRAPMNSQVIDIHARPGELVDAKGIVELAKTDSMFVDAEVYETDIARVKKGQRAEITTDWLPGKIQGTVEVVGLKLAKKEIRETDPSAYADSRVVEVKIRLEESQKVAGMIHAQVNVRILP
jgi:HlyD family secretion protein